MDTFCRHCYPRDDDAGFTLVEMVISVGLIGFVFFALSSAMAAGLKSVALQKARTQGNEVATQGIEDLQRYGFSTLEVCGPPSPARAGLNLTVASNSSGCTAAPAATKATYGDHPCQPSSATPTGVAAAEYTCTRINRTYTIKRYVAWTDSGQTAKRMAVYVSWQDQLGTHEVSQQSSLRSPATGDILGVDPPSFVSGTVAATPTMNDVTFSGTTQNPNSISFAAEVKGLADLSKDRVYVSYLVVAADGSVTSQTTSLTGTVTNAAEKLSSWTGGASHVFPVGSQYVTFNAVRDIDGKTGASLSDTVSFCPGNDCSMVTPAVPAFQLDSGVVLQETNPLVLKIDSSGRLIEPFTLKAKTKDMGEIDRVNVQLATRGGAVSVALTAVNTDASPCTAESCLWMAIVEPASGYGFREGTNDAFFTASQASSTSTAAAKSSPLKAEVQP